MISTIQTLIFINQIKTQKKFEQYLKIVSIIKINESKILKI